MLVDYDATSLETRYFVVLELNDTQKYAQRMGMWKFPMAYIAAKLPLFVAKT
jgi:hypothetical protein